MRAIFFALVLLATACEPRGPGSPLQSRAQAARAAEVSASDTPATLRLGDADQWGYQELDWLDMIPADELAAMERGDIPEVLHQGERAMPQFGSYRTVPEVLGKDIRLPGYIVPLEVGASGKVSEFLFVPYYGACIHMPPPPPNQIVHVRLDTPFELQDMYAAFFLSGNLVAEKIEGELAGSAYVMQNGQVRPYDDTE